MAKLMISVALSSGYLGSGICIAHEPGSARLTTIVSKITTTCNFIAWIIGLIYMMVAI